MREERWTAVTKSEFEHERRGLEAIREKLPGTGPWRAWSNFTFTANSGHVREVDLLVVAPGCVHMVELKEWHGQVTSENGTWVQTTPGGRRVAHSNPLHLVTKKARELAGLLGKNNARVYVSSAVCFTDSSLRMRLPPQDQNGVYTVDELVDMLRQPPANEKRRITEVEARAVTKALSQIGIRRSDSQYKVGPYLLDRTPLDTGPTWADYQARHTELTETVRVRIYLSERGADSSIRQSVEAAARREADVLGRFHHPGVVELKQYHPSGHSAGPALILDHDPDTLRLDHYLAHYGDKLDILGRVALVRQLAETVRSAHSSHIHHRALAARSVHVLPRARAGQGDTAGEDAAWLAPRLRVSDWQIALHRSDGTARSGQRLASTTLSPVHLADDADPYLAPELTASRPDPVALDVYGLGVLTYFLVTGTAPASSQAELLSRLDAGEGLRPSALVDGLSEDIDDLVQAATAYQPERRLATVDEFLEMLEFVEETLTAPADTATAQDSEPEKDPLDAVAGDVLDGRWEVRRRLGTGSTSRAFLVRDLHADANTRGARALAVFKVALSDSRAELVSREAEVLRGLRAAQGIIQLVEPEPLTIGGRTVLALEYVGDERDAAPEESSSTNPRLRQETVARQLRESGRLQVDQLEAYGDNLFGAIDSLEGEGVWHRDLKPDNVAIRVRPNRTRELVLIDFSLAGYPAQDTEAGTEGYLDPFVGTLTRSVYDAHAERYALAVTLHEMASGELPTWGDGTVAPPQTDPETRPSPTLATEAFDPAVREKLVAFFHKALHRDATQRFNDLKPMRDAWRKIFLDTERTVTSGRRVTRHPAPESAEGGEQAALGLAEAEPISAEQQRNQVAAEADRATHLSAAGLTPAAQSFLYGLGITTVGELLEHSKRQLVNARGLGAKTRNEIQRRQREWGKRLNQTPASPLTATGRNAAKQELEEVGTGKYSAGESAVAGELATSEDAEVLPRDALRSVSLDTLATILAPELRKNGSNRNEVEMVRLLLRLPDERGELPGIGVWPKQKDVADALELSPGRIPQLLKPQRTRWHKHSAVRELRAEILELLTGLGRVASAAELADALAVRRGTRLHKRHQRRALALAAVRAVVEVEQLTPADSAFRHSANREAVDEAMGAGLLALEVGEDDAPDTPSAPGLLDYAQRLGRAADRLAQLDTLPTATTVLGELGAVAPPPGAVEWDERRMVEVAAAASRNAAATPRLEIYPRDLPLVRALRLTQAGLVRHTPHIPREYRPGLTAEEVHDRVRARFPELTDDRGDSVLPTGGPLTSALRQAGFDLTLATRQDTGTLRYLPAHEESDSTSQSRQGRRHSTHDGAHTRHADDPRIAAAVRAEERLATSARRDGFRALTVRMGVSDQAVTELAGPESRFDAEQVSVTALFLATMRELVQPGTKPTWDTILRADAAEPGTKGAVKLAEYTRTAWGRVEPQLHARLDAATGTGPVLLTEAAVFARYDAMGVLGRLAETARRGGCGLWLLCPQSDPKREPRLGTVAVPYQEGLGEWIQLVEAWVDNTHRSGAQR